MVAVFGPGSSILNSKSRPTTPTPPTEPIRSSKLCKSVKFLKMEDVQKDVGHGGPRVYTGINPPTILESLCSIITSNAATCEAADKCLGIIIGSDEKRHYVGPASRINIAEPNKAIALCFTSKSHGNTYKH